MVVLRGTTQSTVTPLEIMIRRLWWTPMWNFLFKKIRTRSEANNLALESLWKGKRFDRQDIFDWLLLIGLLVTLIIIFILWKTKDQMLLGRLLSLCVCVDVWSLSNQPTAGWHFSPPPPPFLSSLCHQYLQRCQTGLPCVGSLLHESQKSKTVSQRGPTTAPLNSTLCAPKNGEARCQTHERKKGGVNDKLRKKKKKNHMINITRGTGAGKKEMFASRTESFHYSRRLRLPKNPLLISPAISHMIRSTLLPPFQHG